MEKVKTKKIFIVLDILIILIVIYFFLGYLNFNRIKNNKSPLFSFSITEKINNSNKIKIYHYGLYKIIKNEKINSNVSYKLRMFN